MRATRAAHKDLVLPCSGCFGNPETGVQDVKETEIAHWEDHVEDNPGSGLLPDICQNVREGFPGLSLSQSDGQV